MIVRGDLVKCPQCGENVRVVESDAFRGMSNLRVTLSCGHVPLKGDVVTNES